VDVYKYKNEFDYSRYDDLQMRIQMCNVPWDMGEAHIGNRTISGIGNVVFFENDWLLACGILNTDILSEFIDKFMDQTSVMIHKTTKKTESDVDIRPLIYEMGLCQKAELPDDVRSHIERANYSMPIFMKLKTGSSANLKPETVISAMCAFAGIEYDPLALRILRLDLYGEDGKPLSETGRSF
jgi:hypothetical protein